MRLPRFMLAGSSSGSGKTLITCGVLNVLKKKEIQTAAFKCGPDYIDPMFHKSVIGTPSWNLDTFFTGQELTRALLGEHGRDIDVAVMEGVMGYYDGAAGTTSLAGAYDLADATDTPVILIVNSKGMSLSAAALIKGFLEFRDNSHIKGVILNRMSPSLYPRLKALIEETLPVRVLGYVPEVPECVFGSRHLGLLMPGEVQELKDKLERLSEVLEDSLDFEGILEIAGSAPELMTAGLQDVMRKQDSVKDNLRIAVARDEAFCFIYGDNLEFLKGAGAEPVFFSPLHDRQLPEKTAGLLLYGGYPENHAAALSENRSMREDIRNKIEGGLPCIAECGGFMYLHDALQDQEGKLHEMCGVIHGNAFWKGRLTRFGYISLKQNPDSHFPFGYKGEGTFPAHEFHYFDSDSPGQSFHASKPFLKRSWDCIHTSATMFAGFPHLYYYACPELIHAFLREAGSYSKTQIGSAGGQL